jgi:hypothetical protein
MTKLGIQPESLHPRWTRRAAIIFGLLLAAVRTPAALGEARCTLGDAQALFQGLAVPAVMVERDLEHPRFVRRLGGVDDTPGQCQYRTWNDGATYTFSETDYFLGGSAAFVDYEGQGLTRKEVMDELDAVQSRLWLVELPPGGSGEPVEQPLMQTAYKQITTPDGVKLLYVQVGFIGHLPAGEYLSILEETPPGGPAVTYTVHLVITPAQ